MPQPETLSAPSALVTVAAFAAAIEAGDRSVPASIRVARGDPASRFAIHRNNVWVARLEAIDALFPVLRRLVGDDFLHALTRRFFAERAPSTPVVGDWAGPFQAWLARDAEVAAWPWISDVAALEAAWLAAHHAAEARPLSLADLARLSPERLASSRLRLHPSLTLVASPFAIGSIWAAHRSDGEPAPFDASVAETVLVVRPEADVVVAILGTGEAAFVAALTGGVPVIEAAEAALMVEPGFDVGDRLTRFVRLGAIVDLG